MANNYGIVYDSRENKFIVWVADPSDPDDWACIARVAAGRPEAEKLLAYLRNEIDSAGLDESKLFDLRTRA